MLAAGSVYAQPFWTGSVNMGTDGTINNVQGFDWSSSGSGVTVGMTPGQSLNAGETFNFKYQSNLVDLTSPNGNSRGPFPNLNSGYEYTIVSNLSERVVGFSSEGTRNTAQFELVGGDAFIFFDNRVNHDVASGNGFNDGTQVLKATVSPVAGGRSVFTYDTATGMGGGGTSPFFNFIINPTDVNSQFLDPAQLIAGLQFQGTLNFPAQDSTTLAFFRGRTGEGQFAEYLVKGSDMLFKVDGNSKFIAKEETAPIPEPSTMLLMGAGLLGIGIFARRRAR